GKSSHHRDGDDDVTQQGIAKGVLESESKLALLARDGTHRQELGVAHQEQRDEYRDEGTGVGVETRRSAKERNESRRDTGTNETTSVHQNRVETHGVGDEVTPHHLLHEGLTRGYVKEIDDAETKGNGVDGQYVHVVGTDENSEQELQKTGRGLGEVQDVALLVTVGDEAAVRPENQHGHVLQRHRDSQVHRRPGDLQHQPTLGQ